MSLGFFFLSFSRLWCATIQVNKCMTVLLSIHGLQSVSLLGVAALLFWIVFFWAGFCSVVVKAVRAIVSGAHPWSGASRQVLVACPVHRALVLKCPPPVTA